MSDRAFNFWQRWLFYGCVATAGLGLLLAFFDTRLAPWLPTAINESVWGSATMPADVVTYHRFMHAVLGATIASWATLLAFVAHIPFKQRQPWAWWCIGAAVAVWFPIDTALSLYFGVWPNAVFNTGALLVILAPLIATRSAFRTGS